MSSESAVGVVGAKGTIRPALLTLSALIAIAGCGGDDLLLPSDGDPVKIVIAGGNDQRGTVGQALGLPLVVRVTDPSDRPVPGVEVEFIPPAGGTLDPGVIATTDGKGEASVNYILSTTAGQQMVQAHADAILPASASSTTFTTSADPEAAVALNADGGDIQRAEASTVLPESLAVKAVDRFGNGVAGIEVTWQASDGGSVDPRSVTTGADGRAATARTLGDRAGTYRTSARANDLDVSPVTFSSTATAPPRPELVLVTAPSSTASAGVAFDDQPELQLQDPQGAALQRADVSVTVQIASGGGSLGGKTTAKSNASGRVRFTDLAIRGETGTRTLIFAAEGFTPVTSGDITVGTGPPSTSRSSASVPNGTAGATTTISLRLKDEFGNPVSNAAGTISIAVGGANPTPGIQVTDLGDGSYSAAYVPVHAGADAVSIQLGGGPLSGSPFTSTVAPGPADPTTTTATISRNGVFFYTIDVLVTVQDAQHNPVGRGGDHVQAQLEGNAPVDATDNGNGTYSAKFFTFNFSAAIAVTLNGVPIAGSPFTP
jgi:hypothetical protein